MWEQKLAFRSQALPVFLLQNPAASENHVFWVSISILWVFSFHSVNEVWGLWLLSVLLGSLLLPSILPCSPAWTGVDMKMRSQSLWEEGLAVQLGRGWWAGSLQLPVPLGSASAAWSQMPARSCAPPRAAHVWWMSQQGVWRLRSLALSGMTLTGSVSLLCNFLPGGPDFPWSASQCLFPLLNPASSPFL